MAECVRISAGQQPLLAAHTYKSNIWRQNLGQRAGPFKGDEKKNTLKWYVFIC